MKAIISRYTPKSVKSAYRLLRYQNERKRLIRERQIAAQQNALLPGDNNAGSKKLIVFVVQGADWSTGEDKISGGAISIMSLCEESAGLKELHGADTIMVTMNGECLLLKHSKFDNTRTVYRFNQLADYFKDVEDLIIHLPEYMVGKFMKTLSDNDKRWLSSISKRHLNIMNQNIRLMPEPETVGKLFQFAQQVTITTAHQQYCTSKYRTFYGVPIHKFSVWISPEQYQFKRFGDKEDLLVVSPDPNPLKALILEELRAIPGLTVTIIQNLTYAEYKQLISKAKWSLTFGEGLDGYLIEPVFSGAIGFAVYNKEFFTSDFAGRRTIYEDIEALKEKISSDILALNKADEYQQEQAELFAICAKHYSIDTYRKNIAAFYKGDYTHE